MPCGRRFGVRGVRGAGTTNGGSSSESGAGAGRSAGPSAARRRFEGPCISPRSCSCPELGPPFLFAGFGFRAGWPSGTAPVLSAGSVRGEPPSCKSRCARFPGEGEAYSALWSTGSVAKGTPQSSPSLVAPRISLPSGWLAARCCFLPAFFRFLFALLSALDADFSASSSAL